MGIWNATDPMEQFWSPYSYSYNPISSIDPDGQAVYDADFVGPCQNGDIRGGVLQGNPFEFTLAEHMNAAFSQMVYQWTLPENFKAAGWILLAAFTQYASGVGAEGGLSVVEGGTYSASEMNAARTLASRGNNVVLRPPVGTRAAGGTSDLLVNGVRYDVYTPTTSNANRIISAMAKKNTQASGIVLNLSQSSVTRSQLGNTLGRVQGAGATNITDIIILGGN